jgi:hypothetical protein
MVAQYGWLDPALMQVEELLRARKENPRDFYHGGADDLRWSHLAPDEIPPSGNEIATAMVADLRELLDRIQSLPQPIRAGASAAQYRAKSGPLV